MRRVVCNLARSRRRTLAAEARARLRLGRPVTEFHASADGLDVWKEVRKLPRTEAQATALFYLDDLPIAEIADVLGCAEGTVKAALHRARRRLAAAFETDDDDDLETP